VAPMKLLLDGKGQVYQVGSCASDRNFTGIAHIIEKKSCIDYLMSKS